MQIIALLIVFFGVVNLIRLTLFVVGSNIYSYQAKQKQLKKTVKTPYPTISIIIPAHNEESTILRTVRSIITNKFPRSKREVIVVDDGSTDRTVDIVKSYKNAYNVKNLTMVRQNQSGKAHALNNGIKNYAGGELVMCLDADSYLQDDGLKKISSHFRDPSVVAAAANVKIIKTKTLLSLIQQFEYIVCYQMKRAQTVFNIEYIVGGIGSTFRKEVLQKIGYYDGDTITEDIDLTMKLLQRLGNKDINIIYAADVVANTESVLNFSGLIKQRFRWKWGRAQTFLKNLNMFFSLDKRFTKGLTFVYLPFAIFSDIAFFLEPVFVAFILYMIFRYADFTTILSAVAVIGIYISLNIFLESTIPTKEKIKYILLSPLMYFLFYSLSYVEYVALLLTLVKLPWLKKSLSQNSSWDHVERLKTA